MMKRARDDAEDHHVATVPTLPGDLVVAILRYVPFVSRMALRRVSRSWKRYIEQSTHVIPAGFCTIASWPAVSQCFLFELQLPATLNGSSSLWLAPCFGHMKSLHLAASDDLQLPQGGRNQLSRLERLTVRCGVFSSSKSIMQLAPASLVHLQLYGKVNASALDGLLDKLPKLESLETECWGRWPRAQVLAKDKATLKSLSLIRLDTAHAKSLERTTATLLRLRSDTPGVFSKLTLAKRVHRLVLRDNSPAGKGSLGAALPIGLRELWAMRMSISSLPPTLTTLVMSECVNSEALADSISTLVSLERLEVHNNQVDVHLHSALRSLTRLNHLFTRGVEFPMHSVERLPSSLRYLAMIQCTGAGLGEIGLLTQLRSLTLSVFPGWISAQLPTQLLDLHLDSVSADLLNEVEFCPELKNVQVTRVPGRPNKPGRPFKSLIREEEWMDG